MEDCVNYFKLILLEKFLCQIPLNLNIVGMCSTGLAPLFYPCPLHMGIKGFLDDGAPRNVDNWYIQRLFCGTIQWRMQKNISIVNRESLEIFWTMFFFQIITLQEDFSKSKLELELKSAKYWNTFPCKWSFEKRRFSLLFMKSLYLVLSQMGLAVSLVDRGKVCGHWWPNMNHF